MRTCSLLAATVIAASAAAQSPATHPELPSTTLTIYNQDFAVVRARIDLRLHAGLNSLTSTQVTGQLEPDSVLLRDPSLPNPSSSFRVIEQTYDSGMATQDSLLRQYEGRTISFQTAGNGSAASPIVQGKIIRAPQRNAEPIIQVKGKLEFQLPGIPLFPASAQGAQLKPALHWRI